MTTGPESTEGVVTVTRSEDGLLVAQLTAQVPERNVTSRFLRFVIECRLFRVARIDCERHGYVIDRRNFHYHHAVIAGIGYVQLCAHVTDDLIANLYRPTTGGTPE